MANPHGFDDAEWQKPQGESCLDKTKQMASCTMSPKCQQPHSHPH